MVTLEQNAKFATLIDVLTVRPENQEKLLELMTEQAKEVMAKMPGFISLSLHMSSDGTRIINYTQWKSKDLILAARRSPEYQRYSDRYRSLVVDENPFFCDLAFQITAEPAGEQATPLRAA